ncbi:VWA domain-containing protein [Methylobacterium sp. ID0610]|uniref:VWA domain-containing protein n=1 Tax=Methylobacterium carpenticola TaxID=3344827 RepID=UPI0036A3974E
MGERSGPPSAGGGAAVAAFLDEARRLAPATSGTPRLIFALDATMSRQPTWDLACRLQAELFAATAGLGGLAVQLVYFRGFSECRASRFVADARALTDLMAGIACRGGETQIGRVLRHVRAEAGKGPVKALVLVGDAVEEDPGGLSALAGELGLLGVPAFCFQEGDDPRAGAGFAAIARLSGGVHARFDRAAPARLAALLRAAAVYAARGLDGLRLAAREDATARRLLGALTPR